MLRSSGLAWWRLLSRMTLLTLFLHCNTECALPSYAKDITWFADTEHMYVVNYEADWCLKCNDIRPEYVAAAKSFCKKYPRSNVKFIYADTDRVQVFYDFQVRENITIPSIYFYLGERKNRFNDQEKRNLFAKAFSDQSEEWGLRGLPVDPEVSEPGAPSGNSNSASGSGNSHAKDEASGSGMSGGVIALIVMFVLCLILGAFAGVTVYLYKKKKGPFRKGGPFVKYFNEGSNASGNGQSQKETSPHRGQTRSAPSQQLKGPRTGSNLSPHQGRPLPGTPNTLRDGKNMIAERVLCLAELGLVLPIGA